MSLYEDMQTVLESQNAANEATRQAMNEMRMAMSGMLSSLDSMVGGPEYGPGYGPGGSNNGNPNGGRPTMPGNQTRRPNHGAYSTSHYDPYSNGAQGRGLQGIRSGVARRLDNRYGAPSGNTFKNVYDQEGTHVGYTQIDQNGRAVSSHTLAWGESEEGSSALAGAARRSVASRALGGLGTGGATGAARAIPYVGAAILGTEAAVGAARFVTDQRKQNAAYQSINNGTNLEGMKDRLHGYGFGLNNMFSGGLNWDDSQQAYQGVSALGFEGGARGNSLNFITASYKKMGISVADSLKLITSSAQGLNESLTNLYGGLNKTRDAAVRTGQNANIGQQVLGNNLSLLNKTFSSTSGGTTQLAGSLSALQVGQGRDMAGFSLAPMLTDPSTQYMIAARMGISRTELLGRIQQGDSSVFSATVSQAGAGLSGALSNQKLMSYIKTLVKDPRELNDPNVANRISSQIQANAGRLGLNTAGLVASLQGQGSPVKNDEEAVRLLLQKATGTGYFNANAQADYGKASPTMKGLQAINPVYEAAKRKKEIEQAGIVINGKVMTLEEAYKKDPGAVAKGNAVVAGTGGQTISDMLGGMKQDEYFDPNKKFYEGKHNQQLYTKLNAEGGGASASKKIEDAYTKAKVKKIFSDDKSIDASDVVEAMGGKVDEGTYSQIKTFINDVKDKDGKDSSADNKGTIKVEVGPELQGLLNITGSENMNITTQGQTNNAPPTPGNSAGGPP